MKIVHYEPWEINEVKVMEAIRSLIDKKITDNFTYIVDWGMCNSIPGIESRDLLYIIMKKADTDLLSFMDDDIRHIVKYIVFQLIYGLLCGIHHLCLDIGDIKLTNILVKESNIDREYWIGAFSYTVPAHVPIIMYSDFGLSHIGSCNPMDIKALYDMIEIIYDDMGMNRDDEYIQMARSLLELDDTGDIFHLPYFDILKRKSRDIHRTYRFL